MIAYPIFCVGADSLLLLLLIGQEKFEKPSTFSGSVGGSPIPTSSAFSRAIIPTSACLSRVHPVFAYHEVVSKSRSKSLRRAGIIGWLHLDSSSSLFLVLLLQYPPHFRCRQCLRIPACGNHPLQSRPL